MHERNNRGTRRVLVALLLGALGALAVLPGCSVRSGTSAPGLDAEPSESSTTTSSVPATTTPPTTQAPDAGPGSTTTTDEALQGSGEALVPLDLPPTGGASIADISAGAGGVEVETVAANGSVVAVLVDRPTPYDGSILLDTDATSGATHIRIRTAAEWRIDIVPLADAERFDGDLEGEGDAVLIYDGDPVQASVSNGNSTDLSIVLHGSGSRVRVANSGDVSTTVTLRSGLVEVRADGTWAIYPQP